MDEIVPVISFIDTRGVSGKGTVVGRTAAGAALGGGATAAGGGGGAVGADAGAAGGGGGRFGFGVCLGTQESMVKAGCVEVSTSGGAIGAGGRPQAKP